MVRVRADDAYAFAELYDRHAETAFRVARAVCHDTGCAEDAVQEGFLAIWRARTSFRPGSGSFRAWAMTIVQHRAIDSLRTAATRPPPEPGGPHREDLEVEIHVRSLPDEIIARSQGGEMIARLGRLPDEQARVIVLAFYGELSHSEIATQLSLPQGTVKGRMRLGLEKLRLEMDSSTS